MSPHPHVSGLSEVAPSGAWWGAGQLPWWEAGAYASAVGWDGDLEGRLA